MSINVDLVKEIDEFLLFVVQNAPDIIACENYEKCAQRLRALAMEHVQREQDLALIANGEMLRLDEARMQLTRLQNHMDDFSIRVRKLAERIERISR